MGGGIAKQIKKQFPAAFSADKKTPRSGSKLGTYSCAKIGDLVVINAYTEVYPRKNGKEDRLQAIKDAFILIKDDFAGQRIGIPKIGAGLAGGDWNTIQAAIARSWKEKM